MTDIKQNLILLKINLINQYKLNQFKKGSTEKNTKSIVMLVILVPILVLNFGGYSFALAYGLGYMGLSGLIPAYAVTVTGIITIFFTILKTNGVLFGYRDYDLLMSLPVPTSVVISSRFMTLYFMNMLFTVLFMAPMGVGYAIWMKPAWLFYPQWIIGMLAAPLIPTAIAVIIGAVIMALASRFRYAKAVSTLLTFLLLIASLVLSMSGGVVGNSLEITDFAKLGATVYEQIGRVYPPAALFTKGFITGGFPYFLLFICVSVIVYLLFIKILSLKYKAINTGLKGHITRVGYKPAALRSGSPLQALYRKEMKRFFTSTPYLTNIGTGVIMTLLFSGAMAVMGPVKLEAALGMPGASGMMVKITPFIISAMLAMTCSTCSALSLEGKNLWILQAAPLSPKMIFDSKILVNLTLLLPTALISGLLFTVTLMPDPLTILLLFAAPLTYSVFTAVWGMFLNIKMPNFNWENEVSVIKQSAASFGGMIGSAIIVLIGLGITFVPFGIDSRLVSLLLLAVMWGMNVVLYQNIRKMQITVS